MIKGTQKLSGTAQKTAQKEEKTAQKTAQKEEKLGLALMDSTMLKQ